MWIDPKAQRSFAGWNDRPPNRKFKLWRKSFALKRRPSEINSQKLRIEFRRWEKHKKPHKPLKNGYVAEVRLMTYETFRMEMKAPANISFDISGLPRHR